MAWFADLAERAENLLTNLDEQTGIALRSQNGSKQKKYERSDYIQTEPILPKRRHIPHNLKKQPPASDTKSNCVPSRKLSPTHHQSRSLVNESKQNIKNIKTRKSPTRKSSPMYSLDNAPKTLVGDFDIDYGIDYTQQRRYSLPADLEMGHCENWSYKMQNLEVENAMLKNELNVMNHEVSDLLDRLRKTEDGNELLEVVCSRELSKTNIKLENTELMQQRANTDNESLLSQMEQLKKRVQELTTVEIIKYKDENHNLVTEVELLRDRNKDLEIIIQEYTEKLKDKESTQKQLEADLRHAQAHNSELQNTLEKTTAECNRIEKDWETYKLRVKNMLYTKDNEIKTLKEGININEDTKVLVEQLESLKEERDELTEAVSRVRCECNDMKLYMEQLESRHHTTERVVTALREAMKDERSARNRAETQLAAVSKELKILHLETGQTIASLRTALRDKENELNHMRETTSSVRSSETSALNVADYDVQETIDNDKINYLTQTLIQRQAKIDALHADNNMLKIQLEKLESKYKTEMAQLRGNVHSVVHVQDTDCRPRTRVIPDSSLSTVSMRMGVMMKRYPLLRLLIVVYMIGLHFWVLTVLFTITPADYMSRTAKA